MKNKQSQKELLEAIKLLAKTVKALQMSDAYKHDSVKHVVSLANKTLKLIK